MFATILIIIISIIIIICHLQQKWRWRSMRHINGPTPLPVLGCAFEFGLNSAEILSDNQRLMNIYGQKDFQVKIDIGLNICYLLTANPDIAEFFLSSPKYLKKGFNYNLFRSWIGNGLLVSTGSYWQKRRKAITPTFHFKILEEFVPVFSIEAKKLVKRLSNEVDKDVVDIYPFIRAYTLDSICETAMGTSVNAQADPNNQYVQAVKTVCNLIILRSFSLWKISDFLFKFSKDCKVLRDNEKIIHDFTRSVIKVRRNELLNTNLKVNKNEEEMGIKKRQAFLDLLLVSTIDGKPLSDEDISEEVDTFMFEGHDTTASAISFALYELARNPEVQEKLYNEIEEIFGVDTERVPTTTELNELKYLELVIKETMRMYPSVPIIVRELEEDVTYNGTTYTKGVQLVFFFFYMQRRPDLFENPNKFQPERFLPENNAIKNPFTYIPFSAGPRNCIGQRFAMYELKCVLLKIVQNFQLFPVDAKYEPILGLEANLKSVNGINLRLKKRK